MCRSANFCSELGMDVALWSKLSPLPTPSYFYESLKYFESAFKTALDGDIKSSLQTLEMCKSDEMRLWFSEHGQMSGYKHRFNGLGKIKEEPFHGELEKNKSIEKLAPAVYTRDSFHCRYCEIPVIDKRVFKKFEKLVGRENFPATGTSNAARSGLVFAFRATADHVHPVHLGGRTSLENLVTSCWNCNYGKAEKSLRQIGLDDPRERAPKSGSNWVGLTNYLKKA